MSSALRRSFIAYYVRVDLCEPVHLKYKCESLHVKPVSQ